MDKSRAPWVNFRCDPKRIPEGPPPWKVYSYYADHVCEHLRSEFPNLVSYERFVILMPSVLGPLSAYLKSLYGRCHGISFIDSTPLRVFHNHRIHNHKVFAQLAQRGKGSMGWFYGFKL